MGMEWLIVLGLLAIGFVAGLVVRVRQLRRRQTGGEAPNIYPLW
jgi:hypothetical protein